MSSRSFVTNFYSRICVFILGMMAFMPFYASAQQGRLTDDAQTSAKKASRNFAAVQALEVIGGSDRVFVKFSLPEDLPPGTVGAHVGKATLKLFVSAVNNPGPLGVAGVTSAWSESTITDATSPTIGALIGSVNIDTTRQNQWITFDVTSVVQGWIDNAGSNNGLVLFAAAGGPDVSFDSKESQTTSHQPQLEIVLNHAATADNATTAATAANATQLGGVPAGNFALKSDPVAAGSPNYIQNTTVQQPLSNFNISGNGTIGGTLTANTLSLNIVNANTQFNLGGAHILSTAGLQNTFLGTSAGLKNSSSFNSFFGTLAGTENTTGLGNSFFGDTAGQKNTAGSHNSSFGSGAGFINDTASDNSMFGYHAGVISTGSFSAFFGSLAGAGNTTGSANTFVGGEAGFSNTTGGDNNFFGAGAGGLNTTGASNSFFGIDAGLNNTIGSNNTTLGSLADVGSGNLNFATAIGAGAVVSGSNTIVLGRSAGQDTVQVPGALSVNTFSANILNAGSQFNLAGNRVIGFENAVNAENLYIGPGAGAASTPSQISGVKGAFQNTFLGISAGGGTTIGTLDTFVGFETGLNNTTEDANSYFGTWAGRNASGGSSNSFFGRSAGFSEKGDHNAYFGYVAGAGATGQHNSMFGSESGQNASGGDDNAFFGFGAGFRNNANHNAFFGSSAGTANFSGTENTFIGFQAGKTNQAGTGNTLLGSNTEVAADGLTNATAIGAGAVVGESNALILGNNVNVGIGTSTPASRLTVAGLVESTSGGVKFPDGSIQTTAATGAAGPVVKSLNGLNNDVTIAAGTSNVTITPSGNTLSIAVAAPSGGGGILNQTFLQTGANFNIDGTGAAGIFNAQTQYNLGSGRVLSAPFQDNLFIGKGTGSNSNPSGDNIENVFAGTSSGPNTTECCNAFFGNFTGKSNTVGSGNTFLGYQAGQTNTQGGDNTFVGVNAGAVHNTGDRNTFIGNDAGGFDSTGSNNTSIGSGSGGGVLTQPPGSPGTFNTFIGANATATQQDFTYATAIGANAIVNASNTVVIGRPADTVSIPGTLTKAAGSFKIDDPIDPANKTLSHSFVESPDMMNVYNGNIVTDQRGEAVVTMPEWFEALNRDFRYQLTVIGQFAQAIVAREMNDNRFAIKTDKPNVKVSWQVTGIRHDAYANAHRIPVEEAKPATERGSYLFPAGFQETTQ